MAGPALLQNLIGFKFWFKVKHVALTAEVKAMFLQVKIHPADCKVVSFLWREKNTKLISVYEIERHVFGATISPARVNYVLQQGGRDSGDDKGTVVKLVNRNLHVDYSVKSKASEETTTEMYKRPPTFLANKDFQFTNWICNSENVMKVTSSRERLGAPSKTVEVEPLASSI